MNPYQQGQFGFTQQPCAPNFNVTPQPMQNMVPVAGFTMQQQPQQGFSMPGSASQVFPQQNTIPQINQTCPPNPSGYAQPPPVQVYNSTPAQFVCPVNSYQTSVPSNPAPNNPSDTIKPLPTSKPTVVPVKPFEPEKDAAIVRKALKGFGTNEKAIISVLPMRTNKQRLEIASAFQTMYGKDLLTDLKTETSGRFRDLLVALMTPMPLFAAKELHDAMAIVGTDEGTLIEIICAMSNQDIKNIKEAYHSIYGHSLEDDIRGDTSGNFKKLLTSLAMGTRSEDLTVDKVKVNEDARSLYKAGEKSLGTDEEVFNTIMCSRSLPHLKAVFEEYHNLSHHDIDDAIKSEFSGNSQKVLRALVKMARNQPLFFAERLHKSMKGMGTNDRQLIRIMVMRAEIDLGDIADRFQTKFGKSLRSWIEGDCSGHYKKCLLALLGSNAK